jgi:hypothetical protein
LHCRIDFRHRVWSLAVLDHPQDAAMALNFFARGRLPASAAAPASSAMNATRRLKSRPPLRGGFEKSK